MAVQVNPPPALKIPKAFFQDREVRAWAEQILTIVFQLRRRTGGNTDQVADNEDSITSLELAEAYPWPTNELLEEAESFVYPTLQAETQEFRAVSTSQDYTAVSGDFVNAKSQAQITFPKYPDDNSVIIVRNGDGSRIRYNGNGKTINGSLTGYSTRKTTAIEFYYFIDDDEWVAR